MDNKLYYQGIFGLRNAGVKLEYTKQQIQEIIKCTNDIPYFLKNYVKVIHPDKGLVPFELYDYQKEIIEYYKKYDRVIIMSSRQSGKTITTTGFLLHYILFNEAKNVAILANKGETARYILAILKDMYVNLPIWLQQGVLVWNKTFIELENKCKVLTSATSDNALRGFSANILYVDETAFINNWDSFFSSVYPIISAGKNTKIIFSSTPLGLNHFAKLWFEAEQGLNGFKPLKIPYTKVPGRNETWAEKTRQEIGERRFRQEYELEFLGSDNTLIAPEHLSKLFSKPPIRTDFDDMLKIYKEPLKNHEYILLIDPSEGKGQDYSTIQIIDITQQPFEQVAVFRCNTIPTNVLPFYIYHIGLMYNEGLVVAESNIGSDILYILNYEYEYPNIFYWDKQFGLKTTKKVKSKGNSHLKYLIENNQLLIYDFDTIHELSVYAKKGNSFQAIQGEHDDLVMPLVLFGYIVGDKVLNENFIQHEIYKPPKQIENEHIKFFGFYSAGDEIEKISIEED